MMNTIREQRQVCDLFGSPYVEARTDLKVGISINVKDGVLPINGLRHPSEGDTTGWYI